MLYLMHPMHLFLNPFIIGQNPIDHIFLNWHYNFVKNYLIIKFNVTLAIFLGNIGTKI